MKRITYGADEWVVVNEPEETTVRSRRRLLALMTTCAHAMQEVERARDAEVAKLGLPDGVEPSDEQLRQAMIKSNPDISEDEADRLLQLEQAAMVATIRDWSRPEEISRDTFDNMAVPVYEELSRAVATERAALMAQLQVDFEPTPSVDPGNPTGA